MTTSPRSDHPSPDDTISLLARAKAGDKVAQQVLFARYRPRLRRWAHGRLPLIARGHLDTDDLVQETLLKALSRMERFVPRHDGAFMGYLVTIATRHALDVIRSSKRRPRSTEVSEELPDPKPGPEHRSALLADLERYEEAKAALYEDFRTALILRFELDCSFEEIAAQMNRPTPEAARQLVKRALARLAREMDERKRRRRPRS
jgi:RNA polymerase sigma-70 factor, ECF subfamily